MADVQNNAARKIQRFWKSYIDRQVFRYYCKLIDFRNQGDPSIMLKCINPKEATLFDSAFGARVKFRLGGEKFPPNVFYKIFTCRPVQDLCANSPKEYCQERERRDARVLHNKRFPMTTAGTSAWYHRVENNGWRHISDCTINRVLYDPVSGQSATKAVPFEHDRRQRLANTKARKKRRKLEWLRKMYRQDQLRVSGSRLQEWEQEDDLDDGMGYLNDGEDDGRVDRDEQHRAKRKGETERMVMKAADSMVQTFEKKGDDFVEDWAVDELLDWTSGLSFDDYHDDWCALATTLTSDWRQNLNDG